MTMPVSYFPTDDPAARLLPARPEPIMIRPAETALIVVDMQNAYASPGGYIDLAGFDISGAPRAIEKIGEAAAAARAAGMPVIFFQNGWDADYVEAGGPGSPNWHKSNALKTMRQRPELYGKLLAKGGWDYELVADLPPQPGDIVVAKPRYSAFFNTNLDSLLRARGIRALVFTPDGRSMVGYLVARPDVAGKAHREAECVQVAAECFHDGEGYDAGGYIVAVNDCGPP